MPHERAQVQIVKRERESQADMVQGLRIKASVRQKLEDVAYREEETLSQVLCGIVNGYAAHGTKMTPPEPRHTRVNMWLDSASWDLAAQRARKEGRKLVDIIEFEAEKLAKQR